MTPATVLPIPEFYNPQSVETFWRVPYQQRAAEAEAYAQKHQIKPANTDSKRVALLLIDVQNTFCLPEFELFVGGRNGRAAVEDNQRLCEFIYQNLGNITQIIPTLDSHTAMQIFHPIFWVNPQGKHPTPASTLITPQDVETGTWQVNPAIAQGLGLTEAELTAHAYHYVQQLSQAGKYPLTVWPYHSMLGGIGHALVSAVEEAIFFHSIARKSPTRFEIKGDHPLTENYSILRAEVLEGVDGKELTRKNLSLIQHLLNFDAVIIGGQAKSHCVAWTIGDLLNEIQATDPQLARKIYLLEDTSSPVVVPGVVDYTDNANAAYQRFAEAGMHRVTIRQPLETWPNFPQL